MKKQLLLLVLFKWLRIAFLYKKYQQRLRERHGVALKMEKVTFAFWKISLRQVSLKIPSMSLELDLQHTKVAFKPSIFFKKNKRSKENKEQHTNMYIAFECNGIRINHLDLAHKTLIHERIAGCLSGRIGSKFLKINEGSSLFLNDLSFPISFLYDAAEQHIALKITLAPCSLKDLLHVLKDFDNRTLYGLDAKGKLSINLAFTCNLKNPPQYTFSSEFNQQDFTVINTGTLDYHFLKRPFVHDIYREGVYLRSVHLSDKNPSFIPLEDFSELLVYTIIWNEDPTFFTHKGIEADFMGYALATNLAKKKFSRGGSTITMQLARNLFLNHKKNLYRKIEEMMIALLLENVFEISKERLLEIYLNLIEWGPGIYGIGEAAEFYFGKKPWELTYTECQVMAYIIPRPAHFLPALTDQSPQLITNLKRHIQHNTAAMLRAGLIGQKEVDEVSYTIQFAHHLGELKV